MFCPNCGAQLPDGSAFCGSCGYQFNQSEQTTNHSPNKAGKLIPLTFLLTIVLLVISVILPLTTSIFEIPVVNMALSASGASSDDLKDEMDDLKDEYKRMDARYEANEDLLSKKAAKATKQIMKATKKMVNAPSLLNTNKLISTVEKSAKKLDGEVDIINLSDLTDDLDEIKSGISIIIGIVIGMFVLPIIFTLLGGFKKSKVLTILALVFMVISQALLCGFLWVILSLVVYILQAVLCHKAKHG